MSNVRRTFAFTAATLVSTALLAGSAHAASAPQTHHDGLSSARSAGVPADSARMAGYAGLGGNNGAKATFTIPESSCAEGENSSILAAVIAFETFKVTKYVNGGGGVFVICDDGIESYKPVVFNSSGEQISVELPVAAGDTIRVTFKSDPTAQTASSMIENVTAHAAAHSGPFDYFETTDLQIGDVSATSDTKTTTPAFAFGGNVFKSVVVDGQKLAKSTGFTKYNLVDGSGTPLLNTSKIIKHGFTVTPA